MTCIRQVFSYNQINISRRYDEGAHLTTLLNILVGQGFQTKKQKLSFFSFGGRAGGAANESKSNGLFRWD